MKPYWRHICPYCEYYSQHIHYGAPCEICGHRSSLWSRWLHGHRRLVYTLHTILLALLLLAALYAISPFSTAAASQDVDVIESDEQLYIEGSDTRLERRMLGDQVWTTGTRDGESVDELNPVIIQQIEDMDEGIYWQTKEFYEASESDEDPD